MAAPLPGPTRFIPAPAGNSLIRWEDAAFLGVHPRACGEQTLSARLNAAVPGSSPRLRGTVQLELLKHYELRFIPAPAGNSIER